MVNIHDGAVLSRTSVMLVCFVCLGRYECKYTRAAAPAIIYWSQVKINPNPVIKSDFVKKRVACEGAVSPQCCMTGSAYKVKLIFRGIEEGMLLLFFSMVFKYTIIHCFLMFCIVLQVKT